MKVFILIAIAAFSNLTYASSNFPGSDVVKRAEGNYQIINCEYQTDAPAEYDSRTEDLDQKISELEGKVVAFTFNGPIDGMFGFEFSEFYPLNDAGYWKEHITPIKKSIFKSQNEGVFWNAELNQFENLEVDRYNFGFGKSWKSSIMKFNADHSITLSSASSIGEYILKIKCEIEKI